MTRSASDRQIKQIEKIFENLAASYGLLHHITKSRALLTKLPKLFKLKRKYKREKDGVIVTEYELKSEYRGKVKLLSINPDTLLPELVDIVSFSKHENIKLFWLYDKQQIEKGISAARFMPTLVSADHSIIVYDLRHDKLIRISPVEIKELQQLANRGDKVARERLEQLYLMRLKHVQQSVAIQLNRNQSATLHNVQHESDLQIDLDDKAREVESENSSSQTADDQNQQNQNPQSLTTNQNNQIAYRPEQQTREPISADLNRSDRLCLGIRESGARKSESTRSADSDSIDQQQQLDSASITNTQQLQPESLYEFIPLTDVIVQYEPSIDFAYDFSLSKNYNFHLLDGLVVQDTMAVYTPITKEGQRDAYAKMFRNWLHPASGRNALSPNQDNILGVYMLTLLGAEQSTKLPIRIDSSATFEQIYELIKQHKDGYIPVIYDAPKERGGQAIRTTLGRLAYNLALPAIVFEDDNGFYNDVVRKKVIARHLDNLILKAQNPPAIGDAWNNLVKLAALGVTLYPVSIGLDELVPPKEIIDEFKRVVENPNSSPQDILDAMDRVMEKIKEWLKREHAGFYYLIDSGARGSWDDIRQLLVAKGFVVDPQGRIIKEVIRYGYVEGLTPSDFFKAAPAWIKGSMDRSVNTAEPGYITRQLIMALAPLVITKNRDCGSNHFLEVEITEDNYKAFIWRYTEDRQLITPSNAKQFIGRKVKLRTPIFCRDKDGICQTCYGEFYKLAQTREVGILAAQSIGERGTQLIMKTFHTGGAAERFEIPTIVEDDNPAIKQVGDFLIAKSLPITTVFDVIDSDFTYEEDAIFLKAGAVYIYRGEYTEESQLPEQPDFVIKVDGLSFGLELAVEDSEQINITEYNFFNVIKQTKQFAQLVLVSPDISNMLKFIKQLLGGKLTKTWEELQQMLWKYYTFNFGQLSVHTELVTAAMCRNKDNPTIPMRYKPDEPYIIVHIKDVPYLESPLLGLAFENMGKAILYATLKGYNEYEGRSTLEKIIEGSFDKNLSIKQLLEKLSE